MSRRNRKRGKIDKLPCSIREAVDMMIQNPADYTYADIVNFINDNGFEVSRSSVARYAKGLNAQLEDIMLVSENFRAINEELQRNPELDVTEALCRLTAYKMLEAVQSMSHDDLSECNPLKLVGQIAPLVRAVTYKSDMDKKTQEFKDAAYDAMKDEIYAAMKEQEPELYARLVGFLNAQQKQEEG